MKRRTRNILIGGGAFLIVAYFGIGLSCSPCHRQRPRLVRQPLRQSTG